MAKRRTVAGPELALRALLLPVLALQAVHVRHKALILPEAAGERAGIAGSGPDLRILVLGDSSAAGVGVATQDAALSGQLAKGLADRFRLHWALDAKTGATTRSTLARLAETRPFRVDAAVLALGVNDATRLVRTRRWLADQLRLYDILRRDYGAKRLYVSGMPPLGQFTLLPHPLRWVIGRHAESLDTALQHILSGQPDCTHIRFDLPLEPGLMAEDGFHPGPVIYREWANILAARIARDFAG
ncbi:SGNH/GDSL hydrolase family protein [Sedimentitalea sp. JM2-8]|uniref:SGNH/GDSL hydrolase family protein n=1 Tax=Sedimentitalea xiamensis TaxID=3050037 RepID=A0ABT7FKQ1_9RHOB|nr:SGNH/GDSL hydrolase family protein [Sedimentitalea xiamensis]